VSAPALSAEETFRKKLKNFYAHSDAYLRHLDAEDPRYFKRYLDFVERYGSRCRTLLDAGCGTGFSSYLLSQKKEKVVGLDLSPLFVKKGGEKYRRENLLLAAGDILDLPFQDETFDLVGSYLVIETLPDVERGIGEMVRVLKKGGVLIVVAANLLSPIWPFRDFLRILFGGTTRPVWSESRLGALKTFLRNLSVSVSKWFEREPRFIYREPDLSCKKVVGRDSESVCLVSPLDIARLLKRRGFRILKIGSQSHWIEKLFPSFAVALEVVAEKV